MADGLKDISFRGTFRPAQQRILDAAGEYLADRKIHIVAAPGSGKTILGLELIRRIGKPALVLSPTAAIRDQWADRFAAYYLPEKEDISAWVSTDLLHPAVLTTVTYQALYAAARRTENPADLLTAAGIGTVCMDEAHHLRSEWYRVLDTILKNQDPGPFRISLTATPPYDSDDTEWKRYAQLCGDTDEEIYVPELVAQHSLCPHQDYIYFSDPTEAEQTELALYRDGSAAAVEALFREGVILQAAEESGLLSEKAAADEEILDHAGIYAVLLTWAELSGRRVPQNVLAMTAWYSPEAGVSMEQAEETLQYIADHPECFSEAVSGRTRDILRGHGRMEKDQVCLIAPPQLEQRMILSPGKLHSISMIAAREKEVLGDRLRMLVLTDYIRQEALGLVGTEAPLEKTGAVPVFETLRRAQIDDRLAVLTGSVAVLPDSLLPELREMAGEISEMVFRPLAGTGYSAAETGQGEKMMTALVTDLFSAGRIRILVGTRALLGEGWDAPCINTLVLASFVGSYMLSNQMRGRAIRTDASVSDKTADIWHLVTVDPAGEAGAGGAGGLLQSIFGRKNDYRSTIPGSDMRMLERRFACFMGPGYSAPVLETGLDRIDILRPPFDPQGIRGINQEMLRRCGLREEMAARWKQILSASAAAGYTAGESAELPVADAWKAFGGPLRFLSAEKVARRMAEAVAAALAAEGRISAGGVVFLTSRTEGGRLLSCMLREGSAKEKRLFAGAVRELFSPVRNPRYVLFRRRTFFRRGTPDPALALACPEALAGNRAAADRFAALLQKGCGAAFLPVFARNAKGRISLLDARRHTIMNAGAGTASEKIKLFAPDS